MIAGDAADIPMITEICRRLPWDAQGVVLLEASTHAHVRLLDFPEGVSVHWLLRSESRSLRAEGERLARAVHAWCVEWTCTEPPAAWTVWLGPHTPRRVSQMARSLLGVTAPPD